MTALTWDEVAQHNQLHDCWLVVDGDVYDVTDWVAHHPGGNIIGTLAGEDASVMIKSAHFNDISNILQRYKIGHIKNYQSNFLSQTDDFLLTLKNRVKQHFTEQKIDYRNTSNSYRSIIYTILLLLCCWYCLYFLPPWGVIAAIPMGLATCSLIGSFCHERIHGNLLPTISARNLHTRLLNCFMWGILIPFMPERYFQYEHIKHHNHPMNPDEDYDVYALQYFLRLSPDVKWRKHHSLQHLYAPFVYSMYIFIQVIAGYITPFFDRRMLLKDNGGLFDVVMMQLVTIVFHIALPIYLTNVWWVVLCGSIYFMTWQGAIYITSGLPHMTRSINTETKTESWSHYVCSTTINLKCGNKFFDWLCGGLNYHIAHHLLPSVPREHLAEVLPIVESTCVEFDYPYVSYDSFYEYYRAHYNFLTTLGKCSKVESKLQFE